jgi:prepilin-type N-terminal cleavage/methylation domain-containing protein
MSKARDPKRSFSAIASQRRAFSLIELVIVVVIIGIIAAIAIPRMSRGSSGAADSAVAQDLALLRNAVDMYQSEHNGAYPAANGSIAVPDLLLNYSDQYGQNISPTKDTSANQIIYGPYLRSIPTISVGSNKGSAGIAVSTTSGVTAAGGPGIGWLYNSVDGTFQPYTGTVTTDSAGKLYSSY